MKIEDKINIFSFLVILITIGYLLVNAIMLLT